MRKDVAYRSHVIRSFRSRALKRLWDDGDASGFGREAPRIERILSRLNTVAAPDGMAMPGFHFHKLSGSQVRYSVRVTANWRVTFGWEDDDAVLVDYEDYH